MIQLESFDVEMIAYLPFVASVLLGLTFLSSGASKLRNREGFVEGVLEYQVLPSQLAIIYGRILPYAEVSCGLALIVGVYPKQVGLISAILLLSFLIAVTINLVRRRHMDCHCFGVEMSEQLGWFTLLRLTFFLALALSVVFLQGGEPQIQTYGTKLPALLLAVGLFLCLYLCGYLSKMVRIWRIRVEHIPKAQSRRVSLRGSPLFIDQLDQPEPDRPIRGADGGRK